MFANVLKYTSLDLLTPVTMMIHHMEQKTTNLQKITQIEHTMNTHNEETHKNDEFGRIYS